MVLGDRPSEVAARFDQTDRALVAAASEGDADAFGLLYERWHERIRNYLYRQFGDWQDAEEATQDTFAKLWVGVQGRYDERGQFQGWVYRVATNVFLDQQRHRKLLKWERLQHVGGGWMLAANGLAQRLDLYDEEHRGPDRQVEARELEAEVREVLDTLHWKYALALRLREYQELSYDEIAEVLHTTRPAVKSLLFRGRREFEALWAQRERRVAAALS